MLPDRLFTEALARGLSDEQALSVLAIIPAPLMTAGAFFDRMTGFWRYEFGLPHQVEGELIWGVHMWVPVDHLFTALACANLRLSNDKLSTYLNRLVDPVKHLSTLAEMVPGSKIDQSTPLEFEVGGLGDGSSTVDWVIRPRENRTVLLDVKRRTVDFFKYMEAIDPEGSAPEPGHNPVLLFRSVEEKFVAADPNQRLQGVWIVTDIKQDEQRLLRTFCSLDGSKVHFAVLGDWKQDAYVLVRRDEDRQYLLDLFHATVSTRFTFNGNHEG